MIKRVAAIPGDLVPDSVQETTGGLRLVPRGKIVVLGDSARSLNSRTWGLVSSRDIFGIVVRRV